MLDDALVARLGRTPDERQRNWMLFHFLSYRASEVVFSKAVQQYPDLLRRTCWRTDIVENDPQLASFGRANSLGLLPNDLRQEAADRLETAAHSSLDVSFFDEEEMLDLLSPLRLIGMGMALRTTILPSLEERIDEITLDADLDEEPDSHFKKLLDFLDRVEAIGVDADAGTSIDDARDQVRRSIEEIEERKRERDEEADNDTDWTYIVTQKKKEEDAATSDVPPTTRSIFDDVDK